MYVKKRREKQGITCVVADTDFSSKKNLKFIGMPYNNLQLEFMCMMSS